VSVLLFPQPFTKQPAGAIAVRTAAALARDLVLAVIPGEEEFYSGGFPTQSGTTALTVNGWGRGTIGPSTQVASQWIYTVNLASAFDCTLLILHRCVTSNVANAFTLSLNSAEPVQFSSTGSASVFSSTGNLSGTLTLSNGALNCLVGVKRVNSQESYLNGVLKDTSVTGNRTVGAITQLSIGRPGGLNNLENVEHSLILYWQRALSINEIQQISANPWQLFQNANSRRMWAVPAVTDVLMAQACL
jgi:hypothetical protein